MAVPASVRLSSRQHDVVRQFRRVSTRGDADLVLLDGAHLVSEALQSGVAIDTVIADSREATLAGRARKSGATVYEATATVLDAASPVRTPSGIVALARWRSASVADALAGVQPCVLGLVGVQDPGNVGSAIRAADALGATGVLALDDSADPRSWKALRGAMGSTFRLPVARGTSAEALAEAGRRGIRVVAAVADDGADVATVDLRQPSIILLGAEGAGLSPELLRLADLRVTIPMNPDVDSLNVAVTAALLLFEARRQRQAP